VETHHSKTAKSVTGDCIDKATEATEGAEDVKVDAAAWKGRCDRLFSMLPAMIKDGWRTLLMKVLAHTELTSVFMVRTNV